MHNRLVAGSNPAGPINLAAEISISAASFFLDVRMRLSGSPDVHDSIIDLVSTCVANADVATRYRAPLVAFARASDPRFADLASHVPGHLLPDDLLPGAQSVCAFFLPFDEAIVEANRQGELASEVWARAYVETNALLTEICRTLADEMPKRGVRVGWEPPTHNFDPVRLVSAWSHKSVAVIAGLGQLGHHHMLITYSGCAGRLGSVVLDVDVPETSDRAPSGDGLCTYGRGCRTCVRRCPVGALTEDGLDRQRCYARCLENDARFPGWAADVCGKCATGPCALQPGGTG
jgi:epoxyqueuosine reductase QueG